MYNISRIFCLMFSIDAIKPKVEKKLKTCFPRQSLKIFTFRVKLSQSIFFLLGHSTIVKLI